MVCILGCLDTDEGKRIREEMRTWLDKEYDVFEVHQAPPGVMFEYPAIEKAFKTSICLNEPVLYLHTKGAANPIPLNYKTAMMSPLVHFPANAKPEDCQKIVRLMWKNEFTGERLTKYLDVLKSDDPIVACPFTGREKLTWQNGFIINPAAAKEILKTYHFDKNRWYYEQIFVNSNVGKDELRMWDIIWKYYV